MQYTFVLSLFFQKLDFLIFVKKEKQTNKQKKTISNKQNE